MLSKIYNNLYWHFKLYGDLRDTIALAREYGINSSELRQFIANQEELLKVRK